MTSKSQKESELPAKVYQLDAVIKEISDFRTDINSQLTAILGEVKGVVTTSQLEKEIELSEKRTDEKIKSAIKDMHLNYGETKSTVDKWSKFVWGIVSGLVATFLGQLAIIVYMFIGGGFK